MTASPKIRTITTAIVYPNARIHVGWAWECLGADWLARASRALGHDVFFVSGMDEHSVKVQRRAEEQGLEPKAYCDQMAEDITRVLKQMGMSYDRFIRTTDTDHEKVVQALVQRAFDRGDIYQGKYEGYYCEGCEAYYTEKDLKDGVCPAHGTKPKWITEENYFFRLSKYQDRLLKHFKDHPDFLQPDYRKAEIVNFIEAGLKDFSISRSTFTFGIPLPFNPKHVVYVWFDALINYITACGIEFDPESFKAKWPAWVHIIGKDISRFHCVYWPAMLMSLDIELPKRVFAHGFIQIKGERLSKSSGNVVSPDEVMAFSGPDPFRYYLLAENQFSQDGNFAWENLILRNNADLANNWGNLVNRSISMTRKYFPNEAISAPAQATHSAEIRALFEKLPTQLEAYVESIDPSGYIAEVGARSRALNLYIDQTKPWALSKAALAGTPESAAAQTELKEVLYTLLEGIRWTATALLPVLPFGMPEVFRQLAVEVPAEKNALKNLVWGKQSYQPGEPKPTYPRLELPKDETP